jgi:hypothetical protein
VGVREYSKDFYAALDSFSLHAFSDLTPVITRVVNVRLFNILSILLSILISSGFWQDFLTGTRCHKLAPIINVQISHL